MVSGKRRVGFPSEALDRVFDLLDCEAVSKCAFVCKDWLRMVLNCDPFWSRKFHEDFGGDATECRSRQDYIHESKIHARDAIESVVFGGERQYWTCCWPYAIGFKLCSTDVRVVDMRTGTCVRSVRIAGEQSAIACNGNVLVVGFLSGRLGWWDLESGAHVETVEPRDAHSRGVRCLRCDSTNAVSGSWDALIKVWSMTTRRCVCTLSGHGGRVECLQMSATRIVSGSYDRKVKVWDRRRGVCLKTIHHGMPVSEVGFNSRAIVAVGFRGDISVWDLETGRSKREIDIGSDSVTCLYVDEVKIICGCSNHSGFAYHSLKAWELRNGNHIRNFPVSSRSTFVYCSGDVIHFGEWAGHVKALTFP